MPRFVQVCKSTERGSRLFSIIFPESSQPSFSGDAKKTLTNDSCVFCNKYISCTLHGASTDFSVSRFDLDHEFRYAAIDPSSIRQEGLIAMQPDEQRGQNQKPVNI